MRKKYRIKNFMLYEGILNYKFLGDKHRNIGFLQCQRCKM